MPCSADADDVIQNTFLSAFRNFENLRDPDAFKYWLLSIAKNECRLYYRRKYRAEIVSIKSLGGLPAATERNDGISHEILERLSSDAREVMVLYYVQEKSQAEIAGLLGIPVGTVKSRLHYARERFKAECPPHIRTMYERGAMMKEQNNYTAGFPMDLPEIVITKKDTPFFEVKYAGEPMPVIGSTAYEGTYRYPDKKLSLVSHFLAEKECVIHEVSGVKIRQDIYSLKYGKYDRDAQNYYVQMNGEYLRYLGKSYGSPADKDEAFVIHTFLDDGYNKIVNAEDPVRGNPLVIRENPAEVKENGYVIPQDNIRYTTGVYDVRIGNEVYETVGVLDGRPALYMTESYITRDGKCVLRRWYELPAMLDFETYGDTLTAPDLTVNGLTYVLLEERLYK